MQATISTILNESSQLKNAMAQDKQLLKQLESAIKKIKAALRKGGTIYACGNGGSACDAMHLTEELLARFKSDRPGYRAMHFLDPGTITCWGNDYSFETVFERQAKTFCSPKDVLIAISTSGQSPNVLLAVKAAKNKGAFTIGLLGKGGGRMKQFCDLAITVPSSITERIQEAHITLIHIICQFLEPEQS